MSSARSNGQPSSLQAFMAMFPDDDACADYLAERRWPDGFRCPACDGVKGWRLNARPWVWECAACGRQTSVTAGTVLHGTRLPLRTWFLAAYLLAIEPGGISALQLQAKLGIGSYKTAWLLHHKLREAAARPALWPLRGLIDIADPSAGPGAGPS